MLYIWDIPAQIDLAGTLPIFDFFSRNILQGVPKNTVHEVLDFLKNCLGSISPEITQKTENDTVGRYRFGWNFESRFYLRNKIFRAMGNSGRLWFGSCEKIKIKKTKMIEYDGSSLFVQ